MVVGETHVGPASRSKIRNVSYSDLPIENYYSVIVPPRFSLWFV
jgi:hypothetical protein